MQRRTRDVITVQRSERIAISLIDPDSAGYDEMVHQIDELEGSASDRRADLDDEPQLRRVVALRIGTDPDEAPLPTAVPNVGRTTRT